MKKFLKQILITLITTIVTTTAIYGGYAIYSGEAYDFQKPTSIDTMVQYHEAMNKLFNDSLEKAVKILDEPKGLLDPKIQSPCGASDFQKTGGAEACEDKCKKNVDNVSTYCVSVRATDMYTAYVGHLGQLQGTIGEDLEYALATGATSADLTGLTSITSAALYQLIAIRDEMVTKDIEESRRVLEATLGAYNEFMIAYPIHKQYQEIIKNLIKYKNKLKDVRDYIIQFPSTFIDTTSTKCS